MSKGTCLKCGDIVESKYRHDFVRCECSESFLDGGDVYFRAGGHMVPLKRGLAKEDSVAKLDEWS
jgi:hypothetical protein